MKNLEKTLEEVTPRQETRKPTERPVYKGFQKIEDKAYTGPTSIMYWM